jgi:hypothetical protein
VGVTLIHIQEAADYKDRQWGSLPHTMFRENAEFFAFHQILVLLLFASFTGGGNFYSMLESLGSIPFLLMRSYVSV